MAPQPKLPWTVEEDQIFVEIMERSLKKGHSVNSAAKFASEILAEQGYYRKPTACAFHWHSAFKKKQEIEPEVLAIEPEPVKDYTQPAYQEIDIHSAMSFIRNYITAIQSDNDLLKEEVTRLQDELAEAKQENEKLSDIKDKFDSIKTYFNVTV